MLPEEASELELRDYLRVLRRRKWSVLLVTLLVVAAAVGVSLVQTPVYQGSAEILVQSKASESLFDPNTGVRGDPTRLIQTEIQVLRSRPVRDLVREKIGNSPAVVASAVGQTDVMSVKAESTDPERAALIANTYAKAYIDFRRTQSVDDLLAAAEQIQEKILDLQSQIDGVVPPPTATPPTVRGAAPTPATTTPADVLRRKESLQQQQALFRAKLDQLQVDAALKSGGAQLVTPAIEAFTPIRPTPRRNAIVALAVGLMLGVGLAFLREYLDDSLKGKEDVERVALGVPVVGLIPELKNWKDHNSTVLISQAEPHSQAAEAYRSLRTSVQFMALDRTIKVIQVTSPSQAEGKSTTIGNLAVGLAGAGQRVVLVDADLRRPRIHEFFGLDHEVGFTSILLGDSTVADAMQQVPGVPRLYLLASGPIPPNPSEMLASERAGELLKSLAKHADVVLIDCPPVLPVTDATVLAHRIDASLLVVNAGNTKQASLRRAVELLRQVESPLVGIVINGVSDGAAYGYGYGAGYRYAYTADDGRRSAPPAIGTVDHDWSVQPRMQAAPAVEPVAVEVDDPAAPAVFGDEDFEDEVFEHQDAEGEPDPVEFYEVAPASATVESYEDAPVGTATNSYEPSTSGEIAVEGDGEAFWESGPEERDEPTSVWKGWRRQPAEDR